MKSIERAHIVVVADSDHDGLEEARGLCQAGDADACIVAFDELVPDAAPMPETDAPGRCCGVPSLMVVPTLTPHLCKAARRCGYLAAVPATIPTRMFYRRIGAALQRRRAAGRPRRRLPGGIVALSWLPQPGTFGKPTIH
jgi:hypothetical protein